MKKLVLVALWLVAGDARAAGYGLNFTDMGAWVTFSALLNDTGKPITSFRSSWVVPPVPHSGVSEPVYFWNGLEPIDHSVVVQPVLEWDGSGSWAASCYVVTATGQTQESPRVAVRPGERVTGSIALRSRANGTFAYTCQFEGLPETSLDYSGAELVLAVEVLEQYSVNECADLTADGVKFTGIKLETEGAVASLPWHLFHNPVMPSCGQLTTVVNGSLADGEVDITTR